MAAPAVIHGDFRDLPNLASEKVGAKVLQANDDFFAPKENLILASAPVFIPDKYVETGKWMDGWETRRRRVPGHDWCILQLGFPGVISGINVDTSHFLGNYPEQCSVEGCLAEKEAETEFDVERAKWVEILSPCRLEGGKENLFPIRNPGLFSHLRLNIFPDGGVARLRVHGRARPDWDQMRLPSDLATLNLAAMSLGAEVVVCNDMFFGSKDNLIRPGKAASMADGWETKRKRGPGHDWTVIRLAHPGKISRIEIDTHHFKGNFPDRCSIDGCFHPDVKADLFQSQKEISWSEVLPPSKLNAHSEHVFAPELTAAGRGTVFSHLRLNIYPDGGIARLRAIGVPEKAEKAEKGG